MILIIIIAIISFITIVKCTYLYHLRILLNIPLDCNMIPSRHNDVATM